jgi:hypothetical protein
MQNNAKILKHNGLTIQNFNEVMRKKGLKKQLVYLQIVSNEHKSSD